MHPKEKSYVSASQIRGARGLLNWSQEDLANAAGLSIATVRKIESGHISPRDKTLDAIVTALGDARIEFLTSGVRLRNNDVVLLEGEDCYMQLLEDIYCTTKDRKSEVLFLHADPRLVTEEEIVSLNKIRKNGVKWKFISEEGNNHMQYPIEEFRWLPKKFFKRNILATYANKTAIAIKGVPSENLTTQILVIDSLPLAESLRNLYEFIWENCRKPTFTTAPKVYD